MSEDMGHDEKCGYCGTELEPEFVGTRATTQEQAEKGEMAELLFQDVCPNPDCPGKVSDLAPATDPDEGARLHQAVEGEDSER